MVVPVTIMIVQRRSQGKWSEAELRVGVVVAMREPLVDYLTPRLVTTLVSLVLRMVEIMLTMQAMTMMVVVGMAGVVAGVVAAAAESGRLRRWKVPRRMLWSHRYNREGADRYQLRDGEHGVGVH